MRFYGIRSGRNNMSRLIARSIIFNTPKKNYTTTNSTSNNMLIIFIIFVIIAWFIILRS